MDELDSRAIIMKYIFTYKHRRYCLWYEAPCSYSVAPAFSTSIDFADECVFTPQRCLHSQ